MKKFIFAFAVAFVLCVPAFAYSSDSFVTSVSGLASNNTAITCVAPSGGAYFFAILNSSTEAKIYGISQTSGTAVRTIIGNNTTNKYCNWAVAGSSDTAYVAENLAYPTVASLSGSITIYPQDTAITAVVDDFYGWISNPNPTPGLPTSFTLPRGNVLYFQVLSTSDVTFESQFSKNSGLFSSGNVYGPWGDTYQRISVESSLPGVGIQFPRSGSNAIVWEKGEPLNVLGQTKVGVYTDTFQTGSYYAFYNPAYQNITDSDGFGAVSVGSNVIVSGEFSFIRIYSLQQIYDISTSTDDYDTYFVGTPDGDGGVTWVDQDNQVSYPTSGGDNQEDEPISSVSLIESIKRILRNILSEIENIFTFGFSAIRDLVDLMDEFVATFDDLYEWLPEECYTLLIACVSVAIVIGVFKVFL